MMMWFSTIFYYSTYTNALLVHKYEKGPSQLLYKVVTVFSLNSHWFRGSSFYTLLYLRVTR